MLIYYTYLLHIPCQYVCVAYYVLLALPINPAAAEY